MKVSVSFSILVVVYSVILSTFAHAQEATNNTFTCTSICSDEEQDITNPDQTVTYDWNARIPVPSSQIGETVQTFTCGEFDLRLTTFDESDCSKHQQGLLEAGCQCGSSAASIFNMIMTVTCLLLASMLVAWL